MSELKHLTNEEFEQFVNSKDVVLIDFYATWCGPCKMLAPILEKVSQEVGQDYAIAKVNVDEEYELSKQFGIMSIPCMVVFEKGKERNRLVGFRQKQDIIKALKGE